MVSLRAQQPVPGITECVSMPPSIKSSNKLIFSLILKEFASLLVPKTARFAPWETIQRQCFIKREESGDKSSLNGVITGANTPLNRDWDTSKLLLYLIKKLEKTGSVEWFQLCFSDGLNKKLNNNMGQMPTCTITSAVLNT